MQKIVLRRAKWTEASQLKTVNEACLVENYPLQNWQGLIATYPQHCFVAVHSGRVIGYAVGSESTLVSFAVMESYRGKGIGKEILRHFLNGYDEEVDLHVRTSNTEAQKLYGKFDFVVIKETDWYYHNPDESAYVMKRAATIKKYNVRNKLNVY
jgi:ribosomal protein S18 acetylase RimI-like enzyme